MMEEKHFFEVDFQLRYNGPHIIFREFGPSREFAAAQAALHLRDLMPCTPPIVRVVVLRERGT